MPQPDPVPPPVAEPPRAAIANARAWARFRRVMAWMAGIAALAAALAVGWLAWSGEPLRLHMVIATVLGVFLTVLLGAALMTLSFLSSGSGHDAEAGKRFER